MTPTAPAPLKERARPYVLGMITFLALLAVTIALVALTNALHAQKVATHTSQAQAEQAKKIANLAATQAGEAQAQLATDARLLCGGFVPISQVPLPPQTSALGHSIVAWAKTSAVILNCPRR